MVDYDSFSLSTEAHRLSRHVAQNLTGRRRPDPTKYTLFCDRSPEVDLLCREMVLAVRQYRDDHFRWSKAVACTRKVITLLHGRSLQTPLDRRCVAIALDDGVEGTAGIHNDGPVGEEVVWRLGLGIGYILQPSVCIRALKRDLTMVILLFAPVHPGTAGSQDTAAGPTTLAQ